MRSTAGRSGRRGLTVMAFAAVTALSVVACGGGDGGGGDSSGDGFTIGVSNASLSNSFRTQMIETIEKTAQEYIDEGVLNELVIESSDTDTQGQIRQLQNLINRDVDAIIVDAASADALNPILGTAMSRGIKIISVDNAVSLEAAAKVTVDYAAGFQESADWVAEKMGGRGNLLEVDGIAGATNNALGVAAVDNVLAANPGISRVGQLNSNWEMATAFQVVSSWLASGNFPDGVWTTLGGAAQGTLRALVETNPASLPPIPGETTAGWVNYVTEVQKRYPDFEPFAPGNRANAHGAVSVHVAIALLQGQQLTDETVLVPASSINKDNFAEYVELAAGQPDTYQLDPDPVTREQVLELYFAAP